jgi:four helix bundle protein|tara:strand:- start:4851 stop:5228 length:378 start_codon:yes stop_codon:yes gene_type:complete
MQNYRNLEVYQRTEQLTEDIYDITKKFPREELYNITQHIRKTVLSIGANISEGTGRQSDAEFLRFLYISMGSLKELDHFLNIANKLSYITKEEYDLILIKVNVIGKKLSSLINKIKTDKNRATSH